MVLGISGILFSLKKMFKERNYSMLMLLTVVIFYQLSIAFFYNLGRFRAPILADMAVFSGIFVLCVADNFRDRLSLKYLFLALIFGVYVVFGAYSLYQRYYEAMVMEFVRPNGTEIATLKAGEKCIFDYGPQSFGNWMGVTLNRGDVVSKEFKVKNPNQTGNLKFMLFNEDKNGFQVVKINGVPHVLKLDKSDDGYYIVPVTLQNGKVRLEIGSGSSKEVNLSMDNQRFYGRSEYNGEVASFEWIMRFYYTDKE
jgi:hypothetical protein